MFFEEERTYLKSSGVRGPLSLMMTLAVIIHPRFVNVKKQR
jgi:hypothetical protein